jgi:hypothetical protein
MLKNQFLGEATDNELRTLALKQIDMEERANRIENLLNMLATSSVPLRSSNEVSTPDKNLSNVISDELCCKIVKDSPELNLETPPGPIYWKQWQRSSSFTSLPTILEDEVLGAEPFSEEAICHTLPPLTEKYVLNRLFHDLPGYSSEISFLENELMKKDSIIRSLQVKLQNAPVDLKSQSPKFEIFSIVNIN